MTAKTTKTTAKTPTERPPLPQSGGSFTVEKGDLKTADAPTKAAPRPAKKEA